MKKGLAALSCLMLILSFGLGGCTSSLKSENHDLQKQVSDLKGKNAALEKSIKEKQEENDTLSNKIKDVESKTTSQSGGLEEYKDNIYAIYASDNNTYEKELMGFAYVAKASSEEEKLQTIAKALSGMVYEGLPIEVEKVEEVDGKKIAVIDLLESKENQGITDVSKMKGRTWATGYLQGSTGGNMTSTSLIETFLQKEYEGQWIDGVRFLYNHKPCNFEHAPDLSEVSYRK